jgi:hypothetical protein
MERTGEEMTIGNKPWARLVLPVLLLAVFGCNDGGRGDGDDDDGSSDGDSDGDSDVDTCEDDPCACYPEGPYKWFEGSVVSAVDFPAIHGTGGSETTLEMCEAHWNSGEVKSLVFAVGANT